MTDIQRIVPRLIESDEATQLFTAAHLILSIPPRIDSVEAIAVMPGLGEHQRVIEAISVWQKHLQIKHFFVSGTNASEVTQPQLSIERLVADPYYLKRIKGVVTQIEALHTREQTDWIVNQVVAHNIKSLALVVSHWHMPRAYRTLLKSMLNAHIRLPIIPVTIGSAPSQIVPEYKETTENMSAGEAHRIKKYTAMGQIASFAELTNYLDWLWTHF